MQSYLQDCAGKYQTVTRDSFSSLNYIVIFYLECERFSREREFARDDLSFRQLSQ